MVSSTLLSFISLLFTKINKTSAPFGRIPTLLIGDIAQLPPVNGKQVFFASEWHEFFPLFLTTSHRQNDDASFYNILQEVRLGNLSSQTIQLINEKVVSYQGNVTSIDTTYICGFCQEANSIKY